MICTNCHHRFRGNFCSQCGQKAEVDRFDMRSIGAEGYAFVRSLVILFFQTVYRLTIHAPEHLRTFLFKDRTHLLASIEYLLFSGTVVSILTIKFNFFKTGYNQIDPLTQLYFFSKEVLLFLNEFIAYTEQYASLTNIIAIPCFMLCSYLIFYRKKYTMGEHLIVNTYIAAQQALFLLLLLPVILLLPAWKGYLLDGYIVASILYNCWVYYELFSEGKWMDVFKVASCVFLAYILGLIFNLCIYSLIVPYKELIDLFV
ncbi:MAG: conserved rane protein of unknown function [Cytophagaceae bacterium]|jgi:hypothetical protein|nr:conserved rane protein of unknown function [Cytophagaceae bacterium]